MSPSDTNVIKIIESHTELWTNQRVSRRIKLSCNTVWLKAEYTCSSELNIISPSSNDWISINCLTRNPSCCKTLLESLPSFSVSNLFSCFVKCLSNESVLVVTLGVTACVFGFYTSPIKVLALWALSSMESQLLKCLCRIELLGIFLELWASQIFALFSSKALDCFFLFFFHIFNRV